MKIACQSCGAKYSIADDKVQGKKVFKIKCKKCGSDIIVRGDQASPGDSPSADVSAGLAAVGADQFPEDEATRVVGGSGDNDPIWHAAIDDNNTGPFSLAQLKQFAASGQVNGETSVWKDGFADWKPVKDVPELAVQLLSAGGVAAPASVPAAAGGDALFGGGAPSPASSGGGLFAAESKPAAKAAARTAKAGASNDLFGGGAKSSMFGDEAVETSAASSSAASSSAASAASSASSAAASPKLDAASMTGQRNENSVLFSLATLQQVAGSAPAKTETKKDADASGLIDIKSMAGTMGPGGPGSNKSAVDEILSVGGGGGLASPLAAPVLAPMPAAAVPAAEPAKSKGSNTTVIASVLGAAVILVGGGLGAVYLLKSGQPQTQVGTEGSGPNTANAPNNGNNGNGNNGNGNGNNGQNNNQGNSGSAANAGPNNAGTPSTNGAATAPGPAGTTQPAGTAPAGNEPSNRAERTPRATRSSSPSGSSNNSAPSSPSTSPTPSNNSPSSAPAGGSCAARCRGDIACLLSCGTQTRPAGNSASSTASSAPSNAPETPGRNDVLSAMRGVQGAVRACASGQPGPATVSITFASSGRVTTANVAPPFAGTPAGSCIARAVRSATVPAFSRPTFNVNYPFAL
jgi:predicted Zn finger-like uncharacterized protein